MYFRGPTTIYLVHIKTTTFVIENNVSPLKYLINIAREQKWVPGFVCVFGFFLWYVEPPKLHEGLTHLFTKTENFTRSTTEIVVLSSQIDDRPHCTTMYKCTCISEADPDISIRGMRFISETFFFYRNIKRYRDVIQSENYKTW